ncbi:MAG: hypothetical protein QXI19_02690 [Candidatus Caldarchaeum sp.]
MAYPPREVIDVILNTRSILHLNFYYEKRVAADKIILVVITREKDHERVRATQVNLSKQFLRGLADLSHAVFAVIDSEKKLRQLDDVDVQNIVFLSISFSINDNTQKATVHAELRYRKNRTIVKREVDDVISKAECMSQVLSLFRLYTKLLNYEQSYQTYKMCLDLEVQERR